MLKHPWKSRIFFDKSSASILSVILFRVVFIPLCVNLLLIKDNIVVFYNSSELSASEHTDVYVSPICFV
jgi:hypothetical protein